MFHVLNNGLAAICDSFIIDAKQRTATMKGFQIVNGCQTMETIYSSKVMGKKDAKVNLRLVVCRPAQSSLVAKATNYQTRLRAEDFATLDKIQQELQLQFGKLLPRPWYYEIKRRYWKNVVSKDRSEKQRFSNEDGAARIVKLRDAAQRSLAFLGEPITAAQNTALIFRDKEQGGYKECVFPDNLSAYQVLLPWVIYQQINGSIETFLEEILEFEDRNSAREWLEYGRLTAVALVGDGLREYYHVPRLEYINLQKSRELIEKIDEWLNPLAKHALSSIWNYAKNNKDWKDKGPRVIFRRHQTYETELKSSFMPSFYTSKVSLTENLP